LLNTFINGRVYVERAGLYPELLMDNHKSEPMMLERLMPERLMLERLMPEQLMPERCCDKRQGFAT